MEEKVRENEVKYSPGREGNWNR